MLEFSAGQESPLWCPDRVDHFGSAPNFIEAETYNSVQISFIRVELICRSTKSQQKASMKRKQVHTLVTGNIPIIE